LIFDQCGSKNRTQRENSDMEGLMVPSKLMTLVGIPRLRGYVISAAAVLFAFLARYFAPIQLPYVTFFPAVLFCAFFGGRLVGYASVFLCAGIALYFFVHPIGSLMPTEKSDLIGALYFILVGTLVAAVTDVLRVTLNRLAQRQREAETARAELDVLMRELIHRSKNDYSVIAAIVRGVAHRHPGGKLIFDEISEQLRGLALAHDLLLASEDRSISMATLAEAELKLFCASSIYSANGPNLMLNANAARYIGLALHELCTNSSKHGAVCHDGQIEVWWQVSNDIFDLRWRETGPYSIEPPTRTGFGRTLLEGLVPRALEGEAHLYFHSTSVTWELRTKLKQVVIPATPKSAT
jgi:two-component sensor histidine kinase